MLDSYIKIDDIKKLLDETGSINGLIKKSDFQKAITMIEEFRKPEIKPKNRIKNRLHLISMIDSYKKNILDKKVKPEIIIYMERLTNMNFSNRRIELFKTDHWGEGDENERIDISDIVLDGKEIMKMLNISKPTYLRFEKLGLFKKYNFTVKLYVSGTVRLYRHSLTFYKLSDIASNLLSL